MRKRSNAFSCASASRMAIFVWHFITVHTLRLDNLMGTDRIGIKSDRQKDGSTEKNSVDPFFCRSDHLPIRFFSKL